MIWDESEREEPIYIPITEADRPAPTGPPPSVEVIDAVWTLIRENPRLLGCSGRLYDEVHHLGLTATRDRIRLAQLP